MDGLSKKEIFKNSNILLSSGKYEVPIKGHVL